MENIATSNKALVLDQGKLATVLELGTIAALMVRADKEHASQLETAGATLWASAVHVANELGKKAFIEDYWPAAKKVMTSSPEMAEKYACEPNQKSKGKWNVPKYLTQTVSRIKKAMENNLSLTHKGAPIPQTKLVAQIAEANATKLQRERSKNDPIYETRKTVADSIAMLSDHVRKGSHDKEILSQVTERVQALAKLVGYQAPQAPVAAKPQAPTKGKAQGARKPPKATPAVADKQGASERKAA